MKPHGYYLYYVTMGPYGHADTGFIEEEGIELFMEFTLLGRWATVMSKNWMLTNLILLVDCYVLISGRPFVHFAFCILALS
jgi:hypothetical protein